MRLPSGFRSWAQFLAFVLGLALALDGLAVITVSGANPVGGLCLLAGLALAAAGAGLIRGQRHNR